jgi:hypothetical protein
MNIRSTVHPGQRGAKKLLTQYGDRLVCVRYRYDEQRQKRLKTVELIVEEAEWSAPKPSPKNEDLVAVAITLAETALQQQVKHWGGRWNPQRGLWEVRYEHVRALGLQDRIIDTKGL